MQLGSSVDSGCHVCEWVSGEVIARDVLRLNCRPLEAASLESLLKQ